jgi:hypothetical protein
MNQLFNSLSLIKYPYTSPEDSSSSGGFDDSSEETFELLNAEDGPEETLDLDSSEKDTQDTEETDESETTPEEDELKELEDELKPPSEEDINELVTPVRRKEILAKYPKLFKDFPYLEKAYYREQQFTELLPTVQDAKIAVEKAQILDRAEQQIMSGDISAVLAAAKQESQDAFYKIADNYLPALRRVDQQAYYHVLGNVIKDTIVTMVREGRALGDQGAPLQAAANVLNQFVFGSQNFTPPSTLSRQVNPNEQYREQQIQQQDSQRIYSQFEGVKDDLQTKADNVLKSTIDGHIDPRGTMTDYVKNHATKEAFENLETLIGKDARFRSLLDKLWEKAFQTNFDKSATDKIKAAYLSKAKTLLPSVIKKARNDALKGLGTRSSNSRDTFDIDTKDTVTSGKRSPASSTGRPQTPPSGKIRKPSDIPKGMSTLDVLMKG